MMKVFPFLLLFCGFGSNWLYAQTISSGTFEFMFDNPTSYLMLWKPNGAFVYPEVAKNNNIEGKVYFTFAVDSTCIVRDVKLTRGLGYGLDSVVFQMLSNSRAAVFVNKARAGNCAAVANRRYSSNVECSLW